MIYVYNYVRFVAQLSNALRRSDYTFGSAACSVHNEIDTKLKLVFAGVVSQLCF